MKSDVFAMLDGSRVKIPSKETLNHRELIELVTGMDVYTRTQEAYLAAYRALGIDIINRVPEKNAPPPLIPGEVRNEKDYDVTYLGVYDSVCRHRYPFSDPDDLLVIDGPMKLDYHSLLTPVPHKLDTVEIARKESILGETGCYYYQLYTTLFMWGVEVLGWEVYMTAAMLDPKGFDKRFLEPAFNQSRQLVSILSKADSPFVFLHDDLADANGPMFPPAWYEEYIFPRYKELFAIAQNAGKKVIFVADGNMESFLDRLYQLGVDGVMLENPATPMKAILDRFDNRIIIGGMDTALLTFGKPEDIRDYLEKLRMLTFESIGFVLSSPGGLHGNIPLENLIAYFDARIDFGATPEDWRSKEKI